MSDVVFIDLTEDSPPRKPASKKYAPRKSQPQTQALQSYVDFNTVDLTMGDPSATASQGWKKRKAPVLDQDAETPAPKKSRKNAPATEDVEEGEEEKRQRK
jgi:hypothetical protein